MADLPRRWLSTDKAGKVIGEITMRDGEWVGTCRKCGIRFVDADPGRHLVGMTKHLDSEHADG